MRLSLISPLIALATVVPFALDARAQLVITPETDAAELVQGLLGPGVTYVPGTATLSTPGGGLTVSLDPFNEGGPPWSTSGLASTGVFQNGPLGLGGGVMLSTGDVASFSESNTVLPTRGGGGGWDNVTGPGISGAWGTATGVSSGLCADLVGLGNAYDETRLGFEVDVAVGSAGVVFEYAFGSEEYPAYVGGAYNDAFGLYVVAQGQTPTSADNIGLDGAATPAPININGPFFSSGNVVESFILSGEDVSPNASFAYEYNGFTPKLQTRKALTPGRYRVDIVICDGGDQTLDSGVFIGSLSAFADCPGGACNGTVGVTCGDDSDCATGTFCHVPHRSCYPLPDGEDDVLGQINVAEGASRSVDVATLLGNDPSHSGFVFDLNDGNYDTSGSVSYDPTTGLVTYEAPSDFTGTDQFYYSLTSPIDPERIDVVRVEVQVVQCEQDGDCLDGSCHSGEGQCYQGPYRNRGGDLILTTFSGTPVSNGDVLNTAEIYDPNPDGTALEVSVPSSTLGAFYLDLNSPHGVLFVPDENGQPGTETVAIQVCRQGSTICVQVPVRVTVLEPVVAADDTFRRSVPKILSTPYRAEQERPAANDLVPDQGSTGVVLQVSYGVSESPSQGQLTWWDDKTGDFVYENLPGTDLPDQFEYRLTATIADYVDFSAEGEAPSSNDEAVVNITINDTPDPREDPLLVWPGSGEVSVDVLANDVDPDGDYPLRVVAVYGPMPQLGSARLGADGTVYYTAPGPEEDWVGQEVRFSYEVCDSGPDEGSCMTADVVVTFPTPPSAGELKVGTWVGSIVEVEVPLIRGDPDYPATIVGATSGNFNEVEILGDPNDFRSRIRLTARNQNIDTVTLTICDNREICSAASLQVFVEYPPIAEVEVTNPYSEFDATNSGVSLRFNRNAWENIFWVLGETVVTDAPDHGSLRGEGQYLVYTATELVTGPSGHAEDAFTVQVYGAKTREGEGFVYGEVPFAETTVNLQIERSPNSPPSYQGPGLGLFAGQSFTFDLAPYLSDDQNDPVISIEILANSGNTLQSAVVNGTQVTLQALAPPSTYGQGDLTLKLCDARGCNESASLPYVVDPVPQAVDDQLDEITEGQGVGGLLELLLSNDNAENRGEVSFPGAPTYGTLSGDAYNIGLDVLPRTPSLLADAFIYRLTAFASKSADGYVYPETTPSTEATVTVPLNRLPTAGDDVLEVQPDAAFSASVLANDLDPDGDNLSIPSGGNWNVDGVTLTGFAPSEPGDYTTNYTVCDDAPTLGCASATFTLRVLPPEVCYCSEGDPLVIHVIVNDREGEPAGTATCTLVGGAITCPTRPDGTLDVDTDTLLCSL